MSKKIEDTSINSEKRMVKRSWWKIGIIITIIIVLITGISVGLYFAFRGPTNKYEEVAKKMDFTKDISDVQADILDKQGDEIALYFYSEGDAISDYMFLDQNEGSEEGIGPLSDFTNSNDDRYWYAIEIEDAENTLAEQLFLKEDQLSFCEEFESLGNGETNSGPIIYVETAVHTEDSNDASKDIEKAKVQGHFYVSLNPDNDDNPSDIYFIADSVDGVTSEPTQFVIQSGTTMWFNSDGSVETIIKSWGDVPTVDDVSTEWYQAWLMELSTPPEDR